MNDFELLEKQINSGLEEGESIISGIIFLLEAKGSEFQSQFITISEQELQCKIAVSCPQKKSDEEKERGNFAVPKGASSWPPPSSRRRSPVCQARTSVRALKHRICKG